MRPQTLFGPRRRLSSRRRGAAVNICPDARDSAEKVEVKVPPSGDPWAPPCVSVSAAGARPLPRVAPPPQRRWETQAVPAARRAVEVSPVSAGRNALPEPAPAPVSLAPEHGGHAQGTAVGRLGTSRSALAAG